MGTLEKQNYKELKVRAERELRNYPYYALIVEKKGNDDKSYIIKSIEYVLERLDDLSKEIIKQVYFRDDKNSEDIIQELMIDKNKFYKKKKQALEKFIIVLDNIC